MHTRDYNGPERRGEYKDRRKMMLTEDDITAIAKVVEGRHVCRYDIAPQDMQDLMAFVRAFRNGAIDTRKAFRAAAIRMIVWGSIAGFVALLEEKFRWMRLLMRWITGAPG